MVRPALADRPGDGGGPRHHLWSVAGSATSGRATALGLIHAPGLLFLDEPSTGLDPHNRANLQEHIVKLRERYGTTVVLTTHYLDEADSLADRVVVIDRGRVVADDSPQRLKANHAGDRIALTFATVADAENAAARVIRAEARAQVRVDGSGVSVRAVGGRSCFQACCATSTRQASLPDRPRCRGPPWMTYSSP